MNKISLVFFGTPDIALSSFCTLAKDPLFEVKALVTNPPKPAKRGKKIQNSKIKEKALEYKIPVLEPEKISRENDIIQKLKDLSPDFFVTFAFGQILSKEILSIPKFETINLHASLLPKYRGANPICECLLNGDNKTGITTMITVYELDAGDICLQEEIELDCNSNYVTLTDKISALSPELIKKTLLGLYNGSIVPKKQMSELACYTKKMEKSDKILDFNQSSNFLHNKIRAMLKVNTNHFLYHNKIIKVTKSSTAADFTKCEAGGVISVTKSGILIKCGTDALLIEKVKPEGKNEMSAYDWSLGSKIKKGDLIKCSPEE